MSDMRQRLRRVVPPGLRPYLGALRRRIVYNPARVYLQRRRLLKSPALDAGQAELLGRVSTRIHQRDGMYAGHGENYFRAGLSAIACVEEVLRHSEPARVRHILDLPSGFGRELRFFALRFPEATTTACDIQPEAVAFCAREFGAVPTVSRPRLSEVSFDRKFDLIWCGSLVTHLDDASIHDLLKLFSKHLSADGIFIFTFHGDYVHAKMAAGGDTYELAAESIPALVESYERTGYAYQDYPRGLGYFEFHPEKSRYGISLTSPDWLRGLAKSIGGLREVYFRERGWADHQDVLAFASSAAAARAKGFAARPD